MAVISQTIVSNAFSWMKSFVFWFKFHWSLFQICWLKFVPEGPIENDLGLVYIMAWHICGTRGRWVDKIAHDTICVLLCYEQNCSSHNITELQNYGVLINSLWPSKATRLHRFRSTLDQAMTCRLFGVKPLPMRNRYQLYVRNKLQLNLNWNKILYIFLNCSN